MKTNTILFLFSYSICFCQNFYFPFDTNDKWEYGIFYAGHSTELLTITIGQDTLMLNQKLYKPFVSNNAFFENRYFRKEGSKIYEYLPVDSIEYLRYDFSKQKGDTISYIKLDHGLGMSPFIVWNDESWQFFGIPRRVLTFLSPIAQYYDQIADSIGIVRMKRYATDLEYVITGWIISGKVYGTITSSKELDNSIPNKTNLYQNYPNPFNPSTRINYDIPKNTNVKIIIFNEIGEQIETLVNSFKQKGSYEIEWNASKYSSGIYYCTMICDNITKTTKLVLLK